MKVILTENAYTHLKRIPARELAKIKKTLYELESSQDIFTTGAVKLNLKNEEGVELFALPVSDRYRIIFTYDHNGSLDFNPENFDKNTIYVLEVLDKNNLHKTI